MTDPTFRMGEDGCHVWWMHDCMTYLGGDDPTTLTPHRAKTRLPIKDNGWQVQQVEPLTVTPSILCGRCQTHGFITNGAWVGV
jgi:hypothetical protein